MARGCNWEGCDADGTHEHPLTLVDATGATPGFAVWFCDEHEAAQSGMGDLIITFDSPNGPIGPDS